MRKPIWTPEQVRDLNKSQQDRRRHPYTCGRCDNRDGLVATIYGWICPTCDYTQDWCHQFVTGDPVPDGDCPTPALVHHAFICMYCSHTIGVTLDNLEAGRREFVEHDATCEKSPLVQHNRRLRSLVDVYDATLYVLSPVLPQELPDFAKSQLAAAHEAYREILQEEPMSSPASIEARREHLHGSKSCPKST